MSAYELDDAMVRAWLEGHPDGNFSSALREQLPRSIRPGISDQQVDDALKAWGEVEWAQSLAQSPDRAACMRAALEAAMPGVVCFVTLGSGSGGSGRRARK